MTFVEHQRGPVILRRGQVRPGTADQRNVGRWVSTHPAGSSGTGAVTGGQSGVKKLKPFQPPQRARGQIFRRLAQVGDFAVAVVARIELAAQDYGSNSYLDRDQAVALAVFQRPGTNALTTAAGIKRLMDELSKRFPPGIKHAIIYNPTEFIQQSVHEVFVRARATIIQKLVHLFYRWRQAGQIETGPANERIAIRLRRRFQLLAFEPMSLLPWDAADALPTARAAETFSHTMRVEVGTR